MTLRLSVVSEPRHTPRGTVLQGIWRCMAAAIGRGTDNEWIYPTRAFISRATRTHRLSRRDLCLVDTSSNGTYVNGAQVPLGKYHDYL